MMTNITLAVIISWLLLASYLYGHYVMSIIGVAITAWKNSKYVYNLTYLIYLKIIWKQKRINTKPG